MKIKKRKTQRAARAPRQGAREVGTPHTSAEGRTPLPQLPQELLAQVLQHDPLHHRMTAAAAVSKAWKEAAAATVTSISFNVVQKLRLKRMLAWAATQASHLTHLQLSDSYPDIEHNPLLQQLLLTRNSPAEVTRLGESAAAAGAWQGQYRHPVCRHCRHKVEAAAHKHSRWCYRPQVPVGHHWLAGFAADREARSRVVLPQRCAVTTGPVNLPDACWRGGANNCRAWLVAAVRFEATETEVTDICRTSLSRAVLRSVAEQQQLTRLELGATGAAISNSSTPGFSRLTALQVLSVKDAITGPGRGLHPEVLAGMTALRELNLGGSNVLGGEAGVAALFALPALRQLQRLDLINSLWELLPEEAAAQYTALTSSSQLSFLALTGCMLPPEGAWPLLFHMQLPQMRHLILNSAETAPLATADLQLIAGRCPRLQDLCVLGILHEEADLAALQDLLRLTCLAVNHINDQDAVTLAHLTRLHELIVTAPNELTPYALSDLSELKQLTHLHVYREEVDTMDDEPPADTAVRRWFRAEGPDDFPVWWQMYEAYVDETDADGF